MSHTLPLVWRAPDMSHTLRLVWRAPDESYTTVSMACTRYESYTTTSMACTRYESYTTASMACTRYPLGLSTHPHTSQCPCPSIARTSIPLYPVPVSSQLVHHCDQHMPSLYPSPIYYQVTVNPVQALPAMLSLYVAWCVLTARRVLTVMRAGGGAAGRRTT